jgi:hypothetical protein
MIAHGLVGELFAPNLGNDNRVFDHSSHRIGKAHNVRLEQLEHRPQSELSGGMAGLLEARLVRPPRKASSVQVLSRTIWHIVHETY